MPELVTPAPDPSGMALSLFFQHGADAPAVAAARVARARLDALAEPAEFWAAVAAAMGATTRMRRWSPDGAAWWPAGPPRRASTKSSRAMAERANPTGAGLDEGAFRASLAASGPPADLSRALAALWWDAKGDWQRAHEAAQAQDNAAGAWVHAYLHRKEGDLANAAYWYRRAGRPVAEGGLDGEWRAILAALIG